MTTKYDFPELLEHAEKVIGDLSDPAAYRKWVESLLCVCCGAKGCCMHHVKTVKSGGTDWLGIPVCWSFETKRGGNQPDTLHHSEFHNTTIGRMEEKYNINIKEIIKSQHRQWAKKMKEKSK